MILIINNKSKFINEFEKKLKEMKIAYKTIDHSEQIDSNKFSKINGIILSGGRGDPYGPLNLTSNFAALMNFNGPIIGFCLGHEIIAAAFGSSIEKLPKRQERMQNILIEKNKDPIFNGIGKEMDIRKKHSNHVVDVPKDFRLLARSGICPVEAMRHKKKRIYSFQGHPEVSGEKGTIIMKNFLRMCGEKI